MARPDPKPRQPEWRDAICEDCGDEIEIDRDGWRTLCACDAP